NYGPYQFPEKLIPLTILNALADRRLPVYAMAGRFATGSWLYVDDHCRAILAVLRKGREGEIYNVGGNRSLPNLEVVHRSQASGALSFTNASVSAGKGGRPIRSR
ncbi:MAG: NAD-dependent epimerase/dehydratase family protein, partial [Acidobacteriota bacterium]|nr:NAD-dependent epimerase/dehydratase family protein [Acidobacteriota bacterium]